MNVNCYIESEDLSNTYAKILGNEDINYSNVINLADRKDGKYDSSQKTSAQSDNIFEIPDGDEYIYIRGEIGLWRAVILQTILDASTASQKSEFKAAKKRALSTLSMTNKDFNLICDLAHFEPGYVLKKARHAIDNSCRWRNDSAKEKRILARIEHNQMQINKKCTISKKAKRSANQK